MAYKFISLLTVCAVLALAFTQPQGTQNQGRARHDVFEDDEESSTFPPGANWTACDIAVDSLLSCHDCNTRMICKPIGGLLKTCKRSSKPYCNGGLCSAVPSPDCGEGR